MQAISRYQPRRATWHNYSSDLIRTCLCRTRIAASNKDEEKIRIGTGQDSSRRKIFLAEIAFCKKIIAKIKKMAGVQLLNSHLATDKHHMSTI